jgi:hypothetical protein
VLWLGVKALGGLLAAVAGTAAAPVVYTYPIPGGRVASPATQIAFRGLPIARLGSITVTGSRSGRHSGRIEADSDGDGGSFIPARRFAPGEVVTVRTALRIAGGAGGRFRFRIATPARQILPGGRHRSSHLAGGVWHFHSRPDLRPPSVRVLRRSGSTVLGDIFVSPQRAPRQVGPMILDATGRLVWWHPLPGRAIATNFQVQRFEGRPVLTWWQGGVGDAVGVGHDVIVDSAYHQVALVHAASGLRSDLHEFRLIPGGRALLTAQFPVRWNATSIGGLSNQTVQDSVVQEIDVKTGLVLFQWDSLDHVPLADSYERAVPGHSFGYFHANSIDPNGGNFLISARNTCAAYEVNGHTGKIIWELGGRHSSFALAPGAGFCFQHDVESRAAGARIITLFNNAGGPPGASSASSGLKLLLDFHTHTARAVATYRHVPPLAVGAEGNVQQLPNDDAFIGWGESPYFSEFTPGGQMVFDARFVANDASYRAYRFAWTGRPTTTPAIAVMGGRGSTRTVYASWNGATAVSAWRVLGGNAPGLLRPLRVVRWRGFETALRVRSPARYIEVRALSASGQVLGVSRVATVS